MQFLVDLIGGLIGLDLVQILGALVVAVSALISLFLLIPGSAPEKQLQWFLDLLKKLSLK